MFLTLSAILRGIMPALTCRERADQVKKRNYFTKYGEKARIIINALLDKYASEGVSRILRIYRF